MPIAPARRAVARSRTWGQAEESEEFDVISREFVRTKLWPAYDRIGAELLDEYVLFVDETRWPMLGQAAGSAKWHAWTMASEKPAYYEIHDTRGLEAGQSLLAGFMGFAVTDGYSVYDALEQKLPGLRIIQCWAHPAQIRRVRDGVSEGGRTDSRAHPQALCD
jgi:hypothetical protein